MQKIKQKKVRRGETQAHEVIKIMWVFIFPDLVPDTRLVIHIFIYMELCGS